jgi:GNAT superfamily N-acetyltransferase
MTIRVATLEAPEAARHAPRLAEILAGCVAGGASVSFMMPFGPDDALRFWHGVIADIERGATHLLGAFDATEKLVGTVQLKTNTPPNQPHRADVAKLLVHPKERARGVGTMLMTQLEAVAIARKRWLLVLDTCTGEAAERLYERLGWTRVGVVPNFAHFPDGRLGGTTFFWKDLRAA